LDSATGLPQIRSIGPGAPFRWLARGGRDFAAAPAVFLLYGALVALVCFALLYWLLRFNAAFWVLALTCGFVFIAPILAMGFYEGGRIIEEGGEPRFDQIIFVRRAVRQDVFYLGLALLLIYLLWGRIAQIVYGLSTWRLHKTIGEFVQFALFTGEGHAMLIAGFIVGGVIAFFLFSMVVVSAPMLLDERVNVFSAVAASFLAVSRNFLPLMIWAFLLAVIMAVSAATAFAALTFTLPWLGLASWRAYRDLIA
jgi:uncharacterized membrane protein